MAEAVLAQPNVYANSRRREHGRSNPGRLVLFREAESALHGQRLSPNEKNSPDHAQAVNRFVLHTQYW
jgi:hypothetical protein